jgi:hypothetical protein
VPITLYSQVNPRLQIAWDATALNALKFCPRNYQLGLMEGWRVPENIHLDFGRIYQRAVEVFQKARLSGSTDGEAHLAALRTALTESVWEDEDGNRRDLGGAYVEQWRCLGEVPYKNAQGRRAKCPYSHKGKWFMAPGPATCSCGSHTESAHRWLKEHTKNRHTLLTAVSWFCDDHYGAEGLQPYKFPDGTPAVERTFIVPAGYTFASTGEAAVLVAKPDELDTWGEELFVVDNKTTTRDLGAAYWSEFSPHTQFDTYDFVAYIGLSDLQVSGVLARAVQIQVGGVRFGHHLIRKNDALREEYHRDLTYWLDEAERYATAGYWPTNRASCSRCSFKRICSMDPGYREQELRANFIKKHWNPLEER